MPQLGENMEVINFAGPVTILLESDPPYDALSFDASKEGERPFIEFQQIGIEGVLLVDHRAESVQAFKQAVLAQDFSEMVHTLNRNAQVEATQDENGQITVHLYDTSETPLHILLVKVGLQMEIPGFDYILLKFTEIEPDVYSLFGIYPVS
jgi:hypothetical protein